MEMGLGGWLGRWFLVAAVAVSAASPCAIGQTGAGSVKDLEQAQGFDEGDGEGGGDANQMIAGGQVSVKVVSFGVGNRARAGDWAGVLCEIKDLAPKPREVVVRLTIPDPDGDLSQFDRAVATNPGIATRLWLYARLPMSLEPGREFHINTYAASESGDGLVAGGDPVGTTVYRVSAGNIISQNCPLVGVVGTSLCGLGQWLVTRGNGDDYSPTGHQLLVPVPGLKPEALPDRFQGLAAFETLLWSGSTAQELPALLTPDQARSVTEWVQRGGHLVIVLPGVGQTWLGSTGNPLGSILPRVDVVREEGVDLKVFRPLLTTDERIPMPSNSVVQYLRPLETAGPYEAIRVINAPVGGGEDGEKCVVARRLIGAGAVSIVGVEVASARVSASRVLETDLFWHRILGKRTDLVPAETINNANGGKWYLGNRQPLAMDDVIQATVRTAAHAAYGLFLALVVFGLYWLSVGPVGFYVLKQRKRVQHSWMLFVTGIGLFTALAWGGATAIKPRSMDVRHLTFIDHVFGQPVERGRAWASTFLASYGSEEISLGDAADETFVQCVTPWDPPPLIDPFGSAVHAGSRAGFPDARGYRITSSNPRAISPPSRATTKQVQFDWAGTSSWSMPFPVVGTNADGTPVPLGDEIRVLPRDKADPRERDWRLTGSLKHDLPAPMKDVLVVYVAGQHGFGRTQAGDLWANSWAVMLTEWKPGEERAVDAFFPANVNQATTAEFIRTRLIPGRRVQQDHWAPARNEELTASAADADRKLLTLCFMGVLAPPVLDNAARSYNEPLALCRIAHTYDMSRWLTQPCLIIIGQVEDAPSPLPINLNGEPATTRGRTVLRWVYPLADNPPGFRGDGEPAPVEAPPREGPPA